MEVSKAINILLNFLFFNNTQLSLKDFPFNV